MDFSEKTVFVLNHTKHFASPSGDELVLESGAKTSATKTKFEKSLWTNTVDAVLQYCRIVFDLFSQDKPISVTTFDSEEKIHSIWLGEDQSIEFLWTVFTNEGPPCEIELDVKKCRSMPGLETACSMLQMVKPTGRLTKKDECDSNVGRVIVISASMQDQVESWIPDILASLSKPVDSKGYAQVDASEWIFIDLMSDNRANTDMPMLPKLIETPSTTKPDVKHRFLYHQLSSVGVDLYRGLMRLVESHYNLASTVVQDIPMKEEANTTNSGSAMYGVELLHRVEAHDLLRRIGLADQLMILAAASEENGQSVKSLQRPVSGFSKTLGIKWVTPKSSDTASIRYATHAYRVTLADAGNRASACLAQFVLGGRSVALAHRLPIDLSAQRDSSNLVGIANPNEALLLTCHGSVMYLHTLATICPMAHPPIPMAEVKPDDQPADLRMKAFVDQLLRPSRLAPASAHQHFTVTPRERAQQHLERSTRYWPQLESVSFLGSNKNATALFEHLPKEFLELHELAVCKKCIDKLVSSIRLNVSLSDGGGKGTLKRSATPLPVAPSVQAEAIGLALELDHLLAAHSGISAEHTELQNHWREAVGLSNVASTSRGPIHGDNFGSLSLPEMINTARSFASGYRGASSTTSSVPDNLSKVLGRLGLLCRQLRSADSVGKSGDLVSEKIKPEPTFGTSKDSMVFEPADMAVFLDLLQPNKRPRTGKAKLDFVGVATADAKGQCQLYRALREKEKEKTAA